MNLALIGLGLIGGSLGLAYRQAAAVSPGAAVVGFDPSAENLALALERGAITRAAGSVAEAVMGADLVVLATPVRAMRGLLAELAPVLGPDAVVTDVASTKAEVVAWAGAAGVRFVGGHPMAGTEHSGMAAAFPELFQGATYCICPGEDAARVEGLALAVGAKPLYLAPEAHDLAVAAASHVPFIAAAALVQATAGQPGCRDLAATGYRDATRLASGDPAMYRDICLTNRAAIAPLLRTLAVELGRIAGELDDAAALEALFTEARAKREAWLEAHPRFKTR